MLLCLAGTVCGVPSVLGQPANVFDAGTITVPGTPSSTSEAIDLSTLFDFGDGVNPGETLGVKWVKVEFSNAVSGDLYFDTSVSIFAQSRDVVLAVYSDSGVLVASDDTSSGNNNNGAGLSFGSVAERTPPEFPRLRGQNGPLAAGTYWFAVAAGTGSQVTLGASNWSATTTQGYVLGFGDNDTYLEWSMYFGNTTPLPPPANNDCANAIVISEDVGATPAFVGTTAGATADGASPCYVAIEGLTYKDVWFSYVPTASGFAQIVASPAPGESSTPILTLYSDGCGSGAVRCAGSGNFDFGGGTRLMVPVTQGVPVLLSVAMRAGGVGGLRLNVDLIAPPCTITPPVGAIVESEACGDASNDGCNVIGGGGGFGTISPGQTIFGTLFSTTNPQVRDRDWYRLTLTESITAQLTVRGQAAMEAVILGAPEQVGACSGRQLALVRTSDPLAPCVPASQAVVLTPGEYFVAVAQRFADGFTCATGYTQYLLSLTGTPCAQPQVTQNPANVATSLGSTITFTGAMTQPQDVVYTWQWGRLISDTNPPLVAWNDLFDGEFGDIFSTAMISGSSTGTLTISDVDAAMASVPGGLRFRLKGELCAPNFTNAALLSFGIQACTASDVAGANQSVGADGTLTADDIIVFLGWYFAGDTRADVAGANQSTTPDGQFTADDIIVFLGRYFAGC
jgi:hypothetical protein